MGCPWRPKGGRGTRDCAPQALAADSATVLAKEAGGGGVRPNLAYRAKVASLGELIPYIVPSSLRVCGRTCPDSLAAITAGRFSS